MDVAERAAPAAAMIAQSAAVPFPACLCWSCQRCGAESGLPAHVPLLLAEHVAFLIPVPFPLRLSRGSSRGSSKLLLLPVGGWVQLLLLPSTITLLMV